MRQQAGGGMLAPWRRSRARAAATCRAPNADEPVDEGWRPLDRNADNLEVPTPSVDYGGTYPSDSTTLYYWRPTYWRRTR